ncbi:MAG: T9SS type A sorting domain-containing protein [Bacteroidetes bacterium]|nr:T9SS type A sorting domain-containing protein [Bacteroidota bacterium]
MKTTRQLFLFFLYTPCCFAQHWDSLYGGVNRNITCLYADSISNRLFVGGIFTEVNRDTIWGIATWNGNQWDSLKSGIDNSSIGNMPGSTWAIARYGNYIYVGGNFSLAGNLNTPKMARWDGSQWDSIPGGPPNSAVDDIIIYNNELYISGVFNMVGNTPANEIAKWNGTSWQDVGNNYNFNGYVSEMIFYNGNLYIAGFFDDPFGNTCHIAEWNGSNWQFMTSALQGSVADVWDMEVYNNELFVSGLFYSSDGNPANSIMRWNDTTWNAVGGSVQIGSLNPFPVVKKMCVHNGKLFCAGNFEKIGGVPAMGLASWDGDNWCGFNTFFSNALLQYDGADQITFFNDSMYVSGPFLQTDSTPANYNYIAKWIGGNYVDTCGVISTGINQSENSESAFNIFPNPANDLLTIQLKNLQEKNVDIKILDVLGQTVIEKKEDVSQSAVSPGELEERINVSGLSAGVYFVRVCVGEMAFTQKIIIQR